MDGISRFDLLAALTGHLEEALAAGGPVCTVYAGEVPDKPPLIELAGGPDPAGRVGPYVVVYPSPGTPTSDGVDLADSLRDLDWLVQVTVAAGYLPDLLATVDRVDVALYDWAPVIADVACSGMRPPSGFDPGPSRRDDDVRPPRHWAPLQYRLTATR